MQEVTGSSPVSPNTFLHLSCSSKSTRSSVSVNVLLGIQTRGEPVESVQVPELRFEKIDDVGVDQGGLFHRNEMSRSRNDAQMGVWQRLEKLERVFIEDEVVVSRENERGRLNSPNLLE